MMNNPIQYSLLRRFSLRWLVLVAVVWPLVVFAAESQQSATMDQLLKEMQSYQQEEKTLYREREARFLKARNQQKSLLRKAEAAFNAAQKANNPIQNRVDTNQVEIDRLQAELNEQVTALGDVYSIHSEFAGDFAARMQDSLTQLQYPERAETLSTLLDDDQLPDIDALQSLWFLVQQEMVAAGQSQRFEYPVLQVDGSTQDEPVLRLGTFTLSGENGFLRYLPESGEVLQPQRQPSSEADILKGFYQSDAGVHQAVIDPTRGSLLGMLGQTPDLGERVRQGREVGMAILVVGALGLLIALIRVIQLMLTGAKVRMQLKAVDQPSLNNPLGRVLQQARQFVDSDQSLLQSKLDESILKEIPALERWQGLIKLLAAIAPLMGLLGTVIGMIATFQSISLFGSGDPKLMASGISQALVTTVLGLVAAIPLLLVHNLVASLSRSQIQILDEQAAGILARHLEHSHGRGHAEPRGDGQSNDAASHQSQGRQRSQQPAEAEEATP